MIRCTELQTFDLPEKFELVCNGETLKSRKLVEVKQRIETNWMNDYEFSNLDI